MRDAIDGDVVYSEILMSSAAADTHTILLVEGDTDVTVLSGFMDGEGLNLLDCFGKNNLMHAFQLTVLHGPSHVWAFRDRDFMSQSPHDKMVLTSYYDLEMEIVQAGDSLTRLLRSFGDRNLLARLGTDGAVKAALLCLEAASRIGALRLVSEQLGLGIRCKNFPVGEVQMADEPKICITRLADLAVQRTPSLTQDQVSMLEKEVQSCLDSHPVEYLVNGHDLCRVVAALGRKHWGLAESARTLEKALRAAFSLEEFKRTTAFQQLHAVVPRFADVVAA